MIRLGLTGGIASGKSTIAAQFARLGCHLYDADHAVHVLLERDGAAKRAVIERFPEALQVDRIDRRLLGNLVFDDPVALNDLERILHPAVTDREEDQARRLARSGVKVMLSEIPLLYEVGAESRYHQVVTVSCPTFLQRQRAFRRPGMTPEKYRHILSRQWTASERRRRADAEIFTGIGRAASFGQVKAIMEAL